MPPSLARSATIRNRVLMHLSANPDSEIPTYGLAKQLKHSYQAVLRHLEQLLAEGKVTCRRVQLAGQTICLWRYRAPVDPEVPPPPTVLQHVLRERDALIRALRETTHVFEEYRGVCLHCSRFEDDPVHMTPGRVLTEVRAADREAVQPA